MAVYVLIFILNGIVISGGVIIIQWGGEGMCHNYPLICTFLAYFIIATQACMLVFFISKSNSFINAVLEREVGLSGARFIVYAAQILYCWILYFTNI